MASKYGTGSVALSRQQLLESRKAEQQQPEDQFVLVTPDGDQATGPLTQKELGWVALAEAELIFFTTKAEKANRPQGWNAEMALTNLIGEGYIVAPLDNATFTFHISRGIPVGSEFDNEIPYGQTHDMDCPGCKDTPFTASPRSETYWAS